MIDYHNIQKLILWSLVCPQDQSVLRSRWPFCLIKTLFISLVKRSHRLTIRLHNNIKSFYRLCCRPKDRENRWCGCLIHPSINEYVYSPPAHRSKHTWARNYNSNHWRPLSRLFAKSDHCCVTQRQPKISTASYRLAAWSLPDETQLNSSMKNLAGFFIFLLRKGALTFLNTFLDLLKRSDV